MSYGATARKGTSSAVRVPLSTRVVLVFTRLHWQLLISTAAAAAAYSLLRDPHFGDALRDLLSPTQYVTILGVLGGIVALASSVAFAHLLAFIAEANVRKREAYHRLHDRLYELDNFVESRAVGDHIGNKLLAFTLDLRRLRFRDFPRTDWSDRLQPFIDDLTPPFPATVDAAFRLGVLVRLNYCEDLVSEIGVASVRQIVAGVVVRPVLKSFAVLAALMISGVAAFFFAALPWSAPFVAVLPVFFACLSALLFIEIGYEVHREVGELLDFIESDDSIEGQDKASIPGPTESLSNKRVLPARKNART